MFATNQATDAANISLIGDQIFAIARPPNCPLYECRHGLAMPTEDFSGTINEQNCVVDGMYTCARVHFVAADYNIDIRIGSSIAESTGVITRNQQSFVIELHTDGNPILQL